jgi:hypothetical protein
MVTMGFPSCGVSSANKGVGQIHMDIQELITKLEQIEEQAQRTLEEFPKSLTRERLRMIIALARYLRAESSREVLLGLPGADSGESKTAPS